MNDQNDYKNYLEPDFIAGFSNLEVSTTMILQGFMLGLHSSPLHGFSAEFAEHKQYSIGEPLKYVDWKVYGRTEKMYTKRFEDETNLYANIFLDKTASMSYQSRGSKYSKLEYAQQLAAALTHLFIMQKDAVGLGCFGKQLYSYIEPHSYKQQLKIVLKELSKKEFYADSETYTAYQSIGYKLKKSGLSVIISDFLEEPDRVLAAILQLKQQKQDLVVFMIADDDEYHLNLADRVLLSDLESNQKLEITVKDFKVLYQQKYQELISLYERILTEKGIVFKFITTKTNFIIPLREVLLAKKHEKSKLGK